MPRTPDHDLMSAEGRNNDQALFEEAADWLLTLQDAPEGKPLPEAFSIWLSTSSDHRHVWKKVSQTWDLLGTNTHDLQDPAIPSEETIAVKKVPAGADRLRPRRIAEAVAAGSLAIVLFAFAAPNLLRNWGADYVTDTAELQKVHLKDGSVVELGGDTAVAVNLNEEQRAVTLLSGQAFFDVERDIDRPFSVTLPGMELSVLGTSFDVNISSENTTVSLLHGSVAVALSAGQPYRKLSPGEVLRLDNVTGAISIETISLDEIGAWRDGRVFLSDVSVGFVVEMIQRYHSTWITIPSSELADTKVSGLFDLRNPEAALSALVKPFGGKVVYITPIVCVLVRS